MSHPAPTHADPTRETLENDLRKLRKINKVLMDRVERNMDAQGGNAFSLFQTAITLEGRVAERTDELTRLTQRLMHEISQRRETERALLLAKAEAEQANLGKTLFLAAASHDLHQPLDAARLFLGSLANELQPGRPRDLVARVETALDGVTELIDALLEISKLDSGAWAVSLTSFPIAPVLASLAEEFAPRAASCGLRLHVVPSSVFVHTDRVLFRRALANLVSNAIRYTREGHVLIGCRRRPNAVSVQVWDTGIGIPEPMQRHIFQEFRQVGVPARSGDKGFGLGLAIVERIGRLLSLPVDVSSRVGNGSCFSLRVPLGSPEKAVPEPWVARTPVAAKAFAGLRVACFHTDHETCEALAKLLESWGCRPLAATGADTMLAAQSAEPDLILADHDVDAGVQGTHTVETLRRAFGRRIPAIVLCRDRSAAVREAVEACGCGFLAKPIRPARLRAMIGHVLDQDPIG